MVDKPEKYIVFTDGGSRHNPGPAASAYIIKTSSGKIIHQSGHFLGQATNNQAEYQAVVYSLEWLSENHYQNTRLDYFLDSLLVVNQLSGLYKIKDQILLKSVNKIHELVSRNLYQVTFSYIPRSQNYQADLLVNQTLDLH